MIHILLTFALSFLTVNSASCEVKDKGNLLRFDVVYQWPYINFTWNSADDYNSAITSQKYIPQNNAIAGIKYYKDKFYVAMPRICPGTPVTLGYFATIGESNTSPLISPFPDWTSNDLSNHTCDKLEGVQSMEIDADGIMWVLDGLRISPDSKCPPKLVLYDLNDNSKLVHTYTFPEEICLSKGGFLNDIVVDDSDGVFAYITDAGGVDPGLIVYSKKENRAWKLRDASMFPEVKSSGFVVAGETFTKLVPIDGIALSAGPGERHLYYSALTGLSLYSISTDILKNEDLVASGEWRFNVTYIGKKQAPGDGMAVDNKNRLYYGLLPMYGVGKWDTRQPFSRAEIIDQNNSTVIWPDSFAFDNQGYIYLLANHIHKFFNSHDCVFNLPDDITFRILKYFIGAKSYLHPH